MLLGPSGSGKSTLLNILGAIDVPTSGEVYYRDHILTKANDVELTRFRREHVGFVQFYNLIPLLTALQPILMEQLNYNLLFGWFVGLNMDDSVWDVTVFTKNRERLLEWGHSRPSFKPCSSRHASGVCSRTNTVDGTLLEAWASVKSYQRKDAKNDLPPDDPGNATVDFHGEKRSNQTHASKSHRRKRHP